MRQPRQVKPWQVRFRQTRYPLAPVPLLLLLLLSSLSACARPEADPPLQRQALSQPGVVADRPVIGQSEPLPIAQQMAGVEGIVQVAVNDQGFVPPVLRTGHGERVKIHLINQGERAHRLTLPRWGVHIQSLQPGGETYIEFTASEKGRWPFFSDVPGEPEPAPTGYLVVE